jgi:hypothetical protein
MSKDEIRAANLKKEVRLHVLVDGSMDEALRRASEESGAPVAELVRRAIQNLYTTNAKREARIVGSPAPVLIPNRETR